MKNLLKLSLLLILSTGCQDFTLPNGAKYSSFGSKISFGSLSYSSNGVLRVTNWNNDQTAVLLQALAIGQVLGQAAILANKTNAPVVPPASSTTDIIAAPTFLSGQP